MEEEQELIKEFGKEMQGKLNVRSKKGRLGWRSKDIEDIVTWLHEEVHELVMAIRNEPEENIRKECADVANICLFIWDKTRTP